MEELIGWHATKKVDKKQILENGFYFEPYNFSNDTPLVPNDLGAGIYFFGEFYNEDGRERAREYAQRYKGTGDHIIKAAIECEPDKILDLDNQENLEFFLKIIEIFQEEFMATVRDIERTSKMKARVKRGNFDGIYVELLLRYLKVEKNISVDVVKKRTFTPTLKIKLRKISNFPNGQEICVKNINTINIKE